MIGGIPVHGCFSRPRFNTKMKTIIPFLFLILLGGCATTYKQEGSELVELSEISIIDTNACEQHGCPIIQEVDDKWRGIGKFNRYELIPGVRKLRLIFMANGVTASRAFVVKFRALPGRTYSWFTTRAASLRRNRQQEASLGHRSSNS